MLYAVPGIIVAGTPDISAIPLKFGFDPEWHWAQTPSPGAPVYPPPLTG
jgi:hypothetical protein